MISARRLDAPGQLMRGRYLARNPLLYSALRLTDGLLSLFSKPMGGSFPLPRRLLLANWAHMGDVVITTAVFPLLRCLVPDVRLGFLAGSWSKPIFEHLEIIEWYHEADHFKLNRSTLSLSEKVRYFHRSREKALKEICDVGYDASIDLYPFYPNASFLLAKAGIPVRIGFTSGGGGPLLTHAMDFPNTDHSLAELQAALLGFLPLDKESLANLIRQGLSPDLKLTSGFVKEKLLPNLDGESYIVIHTGTDNITREWDEAKWLHLIERLIADGHRIVLTGRGERQRSRAERLVAVMPSVQNLCDLLDLGQLLSVLGGARLLIGVESLAGHLGAALSTPMVILWSGTSNIHQFRPITPHISMVYGDAPCRPCFRNRGCQSMDCMAAISVETVYRVCISRLKKPDAPVELVPVPLASG